MVRVSQAKPSNCFRLHPHVNEFQTPAGLLILQYNIPIGSIANTFFSIGTVLQFFFIFGFGIGITYARFLTR